MNLQNLDIDTSSWKEVRLGKLLKVNYGKRLDKKDRTETKEEGSHVPVHGSGSIIGFTRKSIVETAIILGRAGTVGKPRVSEGENFVLDTAYFLQSKGRNNLLFLSNLLLTINWEFYAEYTVVPALRRKTLENIPLKVPDEYEQRELAEKFSKLIYSIDKLIQNYEEATKTLKLLKKTALHKLK